MLPLYEFEYKFSFEYYRGFTINVLLTVYRKSLLFTLLFFFLTIIILILSGEKSYWILITLVIFFILFLFSFNNIIKKSYNSNKLLKNSINKFKFYQEFFEVDTASIHSNIAYKDLYVIFQAKKYYIFMISRDQGFLIPKDLCSLEFANFTNHLISQL